MLAEYLSVTQCASKLLVSVETIVLSSKDRTPAMDSGWQHINHQWIIPPLSALTRLRRRLSRPIRSKIERDRIRAIPREEKLRGCGLLSLFLLAIIGGIIALNLTTGVLQEIFDFVTGAAFLLFLPYLWWLIRRYNL
jgi:hypothetical protein